MSNDLPNKKEMDLLMYAEKRSQAETSLDRIRKHYINPDVALSERDAQIHRRYKTIYSHYMNGMLKDEILKILQNDFGISYVQARNDIENTLTLFGDIQGTNKKFQRHFVVESARELLRMSMANNDIKNANKALEIITKAAGLDKPDEDGDVLEKIKPIQVELNIDPNSLEILQAIANSGVVNMNDFMSNKTENIDYEEIEEAK